MGQNTTRKPDAGTDTLRWHGIGWPVLSFLGGILVYYLLFKTLVDPLNPEIDVLKSFSYEFLWEGDTPASSAAVAGADLNARYRHAVPSVLMLLSFLAAVTVAFGFILPKYGRVALVCGALALPAGATIGFTEQYNNAIRMAVADCPPDDAMVSCPLDQAVIRGLPETSFTMETLSHVRFLTHFNSIVSVAAILLLAVCFSFLSWSTGAQRLDPVNLRTRRKNLEVALMVAGLVLVFSVATTYGYYHLAASIMQPTSAGPMAKIASAGSTYWGAVYTTVLIVFAAPAMISIVRDIQQGAQKVCSRDSFDERHKWRQQHGLNIGLKDVLTSMAAGFAPVLTAPSLDLIKAVAGTN